MASSSSTYTESLEDVQPLMGGQVDVFAAWTSPSGATYVGAAQDTAEWPELDAAVRAGRAEALVQYADGSVYIPWIRFR